MTTALQVQDNPTQPKTAEMILAQRESIVRCMHTAMRKDVDFGTIPGTPKPTLYKPGAEKLLSMFRLAAKPEVEDLSTPDTIRYRVRVVITEIGSGRYLGEGVGEASSAETKYQWRSAVCKQEWEETPPDRRRRKWKNGSGGAYTIDQVRAEMEDVANTVLKMAKKRAQIDAVLTVTAASDVFSQDLEDLPPEMVADAERDEHGVGQPPATGQPLPEQLSQRHGTFAPKAQAPQTAQGVPVISEPQRRRFFAISKSAECRRQPQEIDAKLIEKYGVADDRLLQPRDYETAVAWLKGGQW